LAPVGIVAAAVWLTGEARHLIYRNDGDLIVATRTIPTSGNPLVPSTGTTREITELVFDRLLRLDDDLELRPHLAKSWEYQHHATVYFSNDSNAVRAAAAIDAAKSRWSDWSLVTSVRDGRLLELVSSNPREDWLSQLVKEFAPPETLVSLQRVRLTVKEAVRRSLEDFLAGALEKTQLRDIRYRDDRVADLYLEGNIGPFLKEIRLYYESNQNLDPGIELMEKVSWVTELDFAIELRDDVRWHDDQPLTAEDLVFSFDEATRSDSSWPLRQSFFFVERMEKSDEHSVRVRCREYYAPALERWARLPILPSHRLSGLVGSEEWNAFFQRPVGTGPYRVEAIGADGELVLGANHAYFRGAPRQETIRYRINDVPSDRLLALKLGRIDVFQPNGEERRWVAATGAATVIEDVPRYQSFVVWNLDRPPFSD
ncbi:MAG: hypothetical protein KDM63_21070, partial [Verrucomicrobiae bacterium]|nr:hypothetical protein [Verrucomicrobiae bacterium]